MTVAAAPSTRRLATVAGGVAVGIFALVIGIARAPFSYDDAWITYRYAFNLASGGGFVYNPGERVLGTSAPGFAALIGVLALPAPEAVPAIGGAVSAAALCAIALAFFAYGVRQGAPLAGVAAAMLFVVNPLALESFGGEMLTQAALALWAVVLVTVDRPALATACAVAATVVRPDGAIVLVVSLAWQTWRGRAVPWRRVMAAAAALGIWLGGLWWYFGAPLPGTLAAKQAQRASGVWGAFGTGFALWLAALTPYDTPFTVPRTHAGFATFLGLGGSGLLLLPWRREWWALAAWPLAACVAFRQMRLPFYHWYAVPPAVLFALGAGLACDGAVRGVGAVADRWRPAAAARRPVRLAAAMVLAAVVTWVAVRPLAAIAFETRAWFPGPGERAYIEIGQWLAARTPADASVGYIEVGLIGYHARRRMIDPFGLVTSGTASAIARRDFLYAYRTHRPDFILHSPVYFPADMGHLEQEDWFRRDYRAVATLDSGRGYPLTVWRRSQPTP
jgi:hypothetical protein